MLRKLLICSTILVATTAISQVSSFSSATIVNEASFKVVDADSDEALISVKLDNSSSNKKIVITNGQITDTLFKVTNNLDHSVVLEKVEFEDNGIKVETEEEVIYPDESIDVTVKFSEIVDDKNEAFESIEIPFKFVWGDFSAEIKRDIDVKITLPKKHSNDFVGTKHASDPSDESLNILVTDKTDATQACDNSEVNCDEEGIEETTTKNEQSNGD
ncbi:hypothetical protein EJF36_05890 [Bacillus sp. HMF5848]|uniref:hypothetical protein n=1 Tax=Bacillus sp. HMF5848 TaxID=2495421 RepID=UPI000F7907ED|nr:hypothetical protein [Bacillus sp. HMF5848]RSK26425.1 hypothetical protein EJF36_05890 [Bacillus sp. HMF5848]